MSAAQARLNDPALAARFWPKVEKTDSCWNWKASLNAQGYGQISINRRPERVHRLSHEFFIGPIPEGLYVLHRCDNRRCLNPAHLFAGTHQDNMDDMNAKGRCNRVTQRGAKNYHAKLTDAQAQEIRELCRSGISQREAGRRYGVTQRSVWAIVNGVGYAS